ncbi:reverse transcriptase domain-containing protein [Tanacetum coccineum]
MKTPVEKRNNKFCEFHREVGHNTDKCMHLKRKIEELIMAGKLSHVIKELKQSSEKDQPKAAKKGEAFRKDKAMAILMVHPWQRMARQRITQSFSPNSKILFPPLGDEDRTEGPMIIEAELEGHFIHCMYVDRGSDLEILYEHCFNRLRPEVKSQMVPTTTLLIGFSGEIIWPVGKISLIVRICDEEHSTSTWMNFMVATEEKIKVAIHPKYPEQTIAIGSTLTEEGRKELCGLLRRNLDIFAWKLADMTGVPRHIAEHRLNVREGYLPVRQKKRSQAPERNKAIQEEVEKLVDADIMKEVHYHSWFSNPVMVKKHDNSWRMCVDFKDLNEACPKYGYPLPKTDWKNAGATYQRLVDKAFQKKIGRNLEVYVDNLLIKSRTEQEIMRDIEETFRTLREINMKLNPKKCTFGVEEGMFLGYKLNTKGIKVCPNKVEAILSLPSPKCLKDVQKLNGKLASLHRFLSKSTEIALPILKTLKKCMKKSDFQWTAKAEAAFKQMKKLIAKLPTLTALVEKGELSVYLAAAQEAASAVLMTEREVKQMPVYFVSRALQSPEINYIPVEKLVLALVHDSKRLKRYFQTHPIIIITDQPIKQVLSKPEIAGRLQKWSIKLGEYDIQYRPRISVKGQILADFIVERPKDEPLAAPIEVEEELPDPWTLFTDGSSCINGSGAGLILTNPEGTKFTYALRFRFDATNNEAEYEALIAGLRIAEQIVKELSEKSIKEAEVLAIVEEEGNNLMTPINEYLTEETLIAERKKARAIRLKSRWYTVIDGVLYKKSFLEPWIRCVGPLQASYVIREIHKGSCSMHARPSSVVAKAIRIGYYWPTMHKDARKVMWECQDCQVHRPCQGTRNRS